MSIWPYPRPDDIRRLPRPCAHPSHPARTCRQYEADQLGILEAPDDLQRANWSGMDYSESAELRIQALVDQHRAAMAQVRKFHGFDTSTMSPDFALHAGRSSSVRQMLSATMDRYVELSATGSSGVERVIYSEADFDPDNPTHMWSVGRGLLAGDPEYVQVLYEGPRSWLWKLSGQRMTCQWPKVLRGRFAPQCLSYTRHAITWARGQFLVAVPTCQECRQALVIGPRTIVR